MLKSIENVGESEGGKVIMHKRGCALTRVLFWPVRIPFEQRIEGREAAIKLGGVVTRVVTDWISGWKPKYARVSETNFIGELNRRSTKTLPFKKPTVAVNGIQTREPNMYYKKGTLMPPYPRVRGIGTTQKFFPNFHLSNNHVLHSTKSCLEG